MSTFFDDTAGIIYRIPSRGPLVDHVDSPQVCGDFRLLHTCASKDGSLQHEKNIENIP
jgi:hypothetical protein